MDINLLKKLKSAGVDDSVLVKILLDEDDAASSPASAVSSPKDAGAPEQLQGETPAAAPEKAAPEEKKEPEPDPVLAAIKELTGAIYASNIMHDSRGADKSPADLAADTLAKILIGGKEG